MPNQDLKSKMRGWIKEADDEKKEVITKPKSLPGVQSILAIDTPVTPKETPSLNQRLRNTKVAVGLTPELLGLTKQINRNIDYVLGDRKSEWRNKETVNKEELE